MEELKQIGKRRRQLGLTQVQLARLSGVSQSLIAKLERGIIDIAYSKAQKIFLTLEKEEKREEVSAEGLMTTSVKSVKSTDKLSKAIDIMEKLRISQLPVLKGDLSIGSISEEVMFDVIQKGISPATMRNITVGEVMKEAFPTLSKNAGLNEVTALLHRNKAVLVLEKGEIKGIIAKADLFKAIK